MKCRVSVNCPTDFNLTVDWRLFNEAFNAVVANAIKYSPAGAMVKISAAIDDTFVTFNVIDSGLGITPENQEMIFDEFYSQQIENHSKGTALSLAIAREILQLHQGNLSVSSTPGEGSNFIFSLPASLAGK